MLCIWLSYDELDTIVHTSSDMSSLYMASWIRIGQNRVGSWNRQICWNHDFWRKVQILANLAISRIWQDSGQNQLRQRFGRFWPDFRILAPTWPDRCLDLTSGESQSGGQVQTAARSGDLPESAVRRSDPRIWPLYIDHFQLPPRWKMTGQDWDPFGKSRWHWPSKTRDFEKNLLITETLKIAEKGTFFCFTLKKVEKMALFLPPPIEICRHLRRVVPTAYRPKFSIFLTSQKPKFLRFFCTFLGPNFWLSGGPIPGSDLPDQTSRKVPKVEKSGFCRITYGSLQTAKKSIFLRFLRFLRFLWFLRFFEIFAIFWLSARFRKVAKKYEFGQL